MDVHLRIWKTSRITITTDVDPVGIVILHGLQIHPTHTSKLEIVAGFRWEGGTVNEQDDIVWSEFGQGSLSLVSDLEENAWVILYLGQSSI